MPAMPTPSPPIAPVAEIERRLQWRALGIVVFLGLMVMLAAMAAVTVLVPVPMRDGLPADRDLARATDLLRDRVSVGGGELRFRCTLLGEAPGENPPGADDEARLDSARAWVGRARARRRDDPRLDAALGHLDLAAGDLAGAEKRYRAVTDGGADVPEARLGLGLALAEEAEAEREPLRARGLQLEAVSQWVAVNPRSSAHAVALYDRAVLLARLGRHAEAARAAHDYRALEDTSAWAARLRELTAR
jgi:hypothetical protein